MSLDRLLNRRTFLGGTVVATGALAFPHGLGTQEGKTKHFSEVPVTAKQRESFEKMRKMYAQFAKLDAKQKEQSAPAFRKTFATYWDSVTKETGILYHIAANPDANIAAWYAWQDPAQRPELQKRIQNGTPVGLAMAEKDVDAEMRKWQRTLLYNSVPGKAAKQTALVLDDSILGLESADEAWSVLDYAHAYAHEAEHNITAGGIPSRYGPTELWNLFGNQKYAHEAGAYAAQLANIFNGTRKVGDAFKDKVHSQYLECRRVCLNGKNIMEKSIESAQKTNAIVHVPKYEELRDFQGTRVTELDAFLEAAKQKKAAKR